MPKLQDRSKQMISTETQRKERESTTEHQRSMKEYQWANIHVVIKKGKRKMYIWKDAYIYVYIYDVYIYMCIDSIV